MLLVPNMSDGRVSMREEDGVEVGMYTKSSVACDKDCDVVKCFHS